MNEAPAAACVGRGGRGGRGAEPAAVTKSLPATMAVGAAAVALLRHFA